MVTLYSNAVSLVTASSSDEPIVNQIDMVCVGKLKHGEVDFYKSKCVLLERRPLNQVLEELEKSECSDDKIIYFFRNGGSRPYKVSSVYDSNGVSVGVVYFDLIYGDNTKHTKYNNNGVKCPDRSRPGYWTIVFEDGSKVTFYVPPKEHKAFSVQAICGPASIAGLALLPLGILGVRRRRNR
ncbi:hypothetical protein E3E38_03590 [Thermococcus sp. 18S1]|uniref:hypothetical protein n=1 Tax=Thermococcus sp. 18S1 TaxID=1638210 RepID=UPI00143B8F95|nr:hypothetical protein [Thermococcus sp. 18S1]NJE30133.1 hypothetical protein [Thermococcus sp. 18S1]